MNLDTITQLLSLNHQFYQTFSRSFSDTRQKLQPGVQRILETIDPEAYILDLGCGNGKLARELVHFNRCRMYVGLDFNADLLAEADSSMDQAATSPYFFFQADLAMPGWDNELVNSLRCTSEVSLQHENFLRSNTLFNIVLAFSVLHHIPEAKLRYQILKKVHTLLDEGGYFIHSEWQFLNSPRLFGRIQPWERIGLTSADVDAGDYLLDWRQGGQGLRYVHHFTPLELASLAQATGFSLSESFFSDGQGNKLGLYQVWQRNG